MVRYYGTAENCSTDQLKPAAVGLRDNQSTAYRSPPRSFGFESRSVPAPHRALSDPLREAHGISRILEIIAIGIRASNSDNCWRNLH
jgi:hypothetical protein